MAPVFLGGRGGKTKRTGLLLAQVYAGSSILHDIQAQGQGSWDAFRRNTSTLCTFWLPKGPLERGHPTVLKEGGALVVDSRTEICIKSRGSRVTVFRNRLTPPLDPRVAAHTPDLPREALF